MGGVFSSLIKEKNPFFKQLYLANEVIEIPQLRPSQLAELSHSEFDPKLFSHSAYVKSFLTFATKVQYLTFCDKMGQFLIGNG